MNNVYMKEKNGFWANALRMIVYGILCVAMATSLIGCGKKGAAGGDASVSSDTLGGKYVIAFNDSSAKGADEMVDALIDSVQSGYDLASVEVEEGYLNGFDNEIVGFKKGVMFAPMIGSIPFVGYVFETTDADALESSLKGSANMRWNICTEADEMVSAKKGDLVFFMMCPNEDQ